jgi:putative nucleotidyltransferase with HDIG domain
MIAQNILSIEDFLAGEIDLCSPPEILVRITSLLDDPTKDANHLAEAIQQDPSLSSKLLKIVNSAFYGFPATISSVTQAITILGANEIRLLVLSSSAIDRFSSLPNTLMNMKEFWSHSLKAALYAKYLAENHPKKRQLSSVFISGLLHDIGRLILYSKAPDLSRSAVLLAKAREITDSDSENQTFGFNHADVGAALLDMWKIPLSIQTAIKHHHDYTLANEHQEETRLVYLANHLANTDAENEEELAKNVSVEDPIWDIIDMPYGVLPSVIAKVDEEFNRTYRLFFG